MEYLVFALLIIAMLSIFAIATISRVLKDMEEKLNFEITINDKLSRRLEKEIKNNNDLKVLYRELAFKGMEEE